MDFNDTLLWQAVCIAENDSSDYTDSYTITVCSGFF